MGVLLFEFLVHVLRPLLIKEFCRNVDGLGLYLNSLDIGLDIGILRGEVLHLVHSEIFSELPGDGCWILTAQQRSGFLHVILAQMFLQAFFHLLVVRVFFPLFKQYG